MGQIGRQLFASESVTTGHPDTTPPQLSGRLLDAFDVCPLDHVSLTVPVGTSEDTDAAAAPKKDAGL